MSQDVNKPEPLPIKNVDSPAIWDVVIEDMRNRDLSGQQKYGTRLQAFNARDFSVDLYQEMLDMVVYTRGLIYEQQQLEKEAGELFDAICDKDTLDSIEITKILGFLNIILNHRIWY